MSSCCSGDGLGGLVGNAAQWAAGEKRAGIRVASGNSLGDTVRNNLVAKVCGGQGGEEVHLNTESLLDC